MIVWLPCNILTLPSMSCIPSSQDVNPDGYGHVSGIFTAENDVSNVCILVHSKLSPRMKQQCLFPKLY